MALFQNISQNTYYLLLPSIFAKGEDYVNNVMGLK